ncbi:MAG TPA: DUF488 domain-containing protein [Gallionella sp.]|nr:DUF488 domain-containing protein [Gallionella sp.]
MQVPAACHTSPAGGVLNLLYSSHLRSVRSDAADATSYAFILAVMSQHPSPQEAHWPEGTVFTIGHSTLPIEHFIIVLKTYGIEHLADIRTIPGSRHNPQFNGPVLAASLTAEHIEYTHMQALGGLRRARKDSVNTGWRNASFRGYADYMQTEAFQNALEMLIQMSRQKRVAIMCAEAVPWRCHRSLVADALNARTVPAVEILSESSYRQHKLTAFAHVEDKQVTYPPEQAT